MFELMRKMRERKNETKRLEDLDLSKIGLLFATPAMFSNALVQVKKLSLSGCSRITPEQVLALLSQVKGTECELVEVILSKLNLKDLDAKKLANAVAHLETVDLFHTQLTQRQVAEIIDHVLESSITNKVHMTGEVTSLEHRDKARNSGKFSFKFH